MLPQTTIAPSLARTSYAAHPVWARSVRAEVKFAPMPKRAAVKLFHDARRFERQTRRAGHQDGRLGRNGLLILHAMLFDCVNYVTGRLDPSYAAIARLANISVRSAARGLAKLRASGVLNWVRRCAWDDDTGQLAQETNAYAVLPPTQWCGFRSSAPPAPEPGTIGAPDPVPSILESAVGALRAGMLRAAQSAFDLAEPGTLAHALGRVNAARALQTSTDMPG